MFSIFDCLPSWKEWRDKWFKAKNQEDGVVEMKSDIEQVVDILNRAWKADPVALHSLLNVRIPCNLDLLADPNIQVRFQDRPYCYTISALGLLNGVVQHLTDRSVALKIARDDNGVETIEGFCVHESKLG